MVWWETSEIEATHRKHTLKGLTEMKVFIRFIASHISWDPLA